jgi:hypothetical protein
MIKTKVVGHAFSSGIIMSWSLGCFCPPFQAVDMRGVDLRGWPVGLVPTGSEGGIDCQWWQTIHDPWHAAHILGCGL